MGAWFPVINAVMLLFLVYRLIRLGQVVTELRKVVDKIHTTVAPGEA